MIVAIAVENNKTYISRCFARSKLFAIYNTKFHKIKYVENPFFDLKTGAGKKLAHFLKTTYLVDSFIAFELGVKVQQYATSNNIQLIIINSNSETLDDIIKYLSE